MWKFLVVYVLHLCLCSDEFENDAFDNNILKMSNNARRSSPNYNQTFFSSLENYQVNAAPVSERQYPWIARVSHSRTSTNPHMCTAVCIAERIFITAARCIYSLKLSYTTVIYKLQYMTPLAFVVPSKGSKQAFDDIGFIVVESTQQFEGAWNVIDLFDGTNRTDNHFEWFETLDAYYGPFDYKVIGYATEKGIHRIKTPDRQFHLTELHVVSDISICTKIMTFNHHIQGFHVPCYHSCTLEEFRRKEEICQNYHGVEGGAIIDSNTNKLMGVATWGAYFHKYELPVGYSIVNSDNFFVDYTCALRIRSDNGLIVTQGYYQTVCDEI